MTGTDENHPSQPGTGARPQPAGDTTPAGRNTSNGTPKPTASANDAHVPDPDPEKHRDEDDEGSKPAGQPPLGNDTHKPPEPAAATAWTHAVDRRANADLPSPNCPEATEKTCALGHASRTTASTPVAQPTTTFAELGTAAIAENNAVEATASSGRREPEKPTTQAEAKKEESMVATGKQNSTEAMSETKLN